MLKWLVFIFRIANALAVATFFQPDEYFQTFEPAHVAVYGYGTLTWEWKMGLRGCLVPLIYGGLYRLADFLKVDILTVCRIFQGVVAAVGDLATHKLATKLESRQVAQYALLASVFSSFYFYCGTRPFANTFEMVCTTVALCIWPWERASYKKLTLASVLAHLAIILRPTNAILWIVMGIRLLWNNRSRTVPIVGISMVLAIAVHGCDYLLDNWYYGFQVWPLKSFVLANIGEKVSHYYGVMPLHFYVSSALPMQLIGYLPVTAMALFTRDKLAVIVWSQLGIYSLLAHKEIRFIFYLLPLLHILFAKQLIARRWQHWLPLFVSVNVVVGCYLTFVHQRGVMSVTEFIRSDDSISDVSFLMPCHSVPGYAFFHRESALNITTLGCDPPVMVPASERPAYVDEADQFYLDPSGFVEKNPHVLAQVVVAFEALNWSHADYTEDKRFFNSHIHEDSRRRGDVILYRKNT